MAPRPRSLRELRPPDGSPFPTENTRGEPILAAGGLLWKETSRGPRIVVIHRCRYDEWALPKGKPDSGETLEQAALREVREETGYEAEIIDYAGQIHYDVDGRPKVVRFWNMQPRGKRNFTPGEEVDRVEWLSVEGALRRLKHEEERRLLARHARRSVQPTREWRS